MNSFRISRRIAVALAAVAFLLFAVGRAASGMESKLLAGWLKGESVAFPVWGWTVWLVGEEGTALAWVSVGAGLICVWLVATMAAKIFDVAIRLAMRGDDEYAREFLLAGQAAVVLSGLSFAFVPAFFVAGTSVSPLLVAMVPPLAALALLTRPTKKRQAAAFLLAGYAAYEFILAKRVAMPTVLTAAGTWLAVGVMPALVIAWSMRKRWLAGRVKLIAAFGCWAAAILYLGKVAFSVQTQRLCGLEEGRDEWAALLNGHLEAVVGVLVLYVLAEAVVAFYAAQRHAQERKSRRHRRVGLHARHHTGGEGLSLAATHGIDRHRREDEAPSATDRRVPAWPAEADRLWSEARAMSHNYVPDFELDADYLAKVCAAAKLGHWDAMLKLGDYADRRGMIVEAYYWKLLAKMKGASGQSETLRKLTARWQKDKCPLEPDNVHAGFSPLQGSLARSFLRIRCSVDKPRSLKRLRDLARRGSKEAKLFLSSHGYGNF